MEKEKQACVDGPTGCREFAFEAPPELLEFCQSLILIFAATFFAFLTLARSFRSSVVYFETVPSVSIG